MTQADQAPEQLALLRTAARRSRPPPPAAVAASSRPVARVAVDVALAHLDRPFDYLVPAELDRAAQPGVRVRVRFAGRLVNGYLVDRADTTEHVGTLAPLRAVVSPEQVLTPAVHTLAAEVAHRYAGSLADVLRLAVPPRHARVEQATTPEPWSPTEPCARPEPGGWARYARGPALLDAIHGGDRDQPARAVWSALPGPGWPDEIARLVLTTLSGGRGALVVLPDHRDVTRLDAALNGLGGDTHHVVLTAEPGPAERYRHYLSILRGQRRAVIGTRAAMFAPVERLGLVVVWDDGDDLHEEPRAPYPHVRTVLALRSRLEGAALVVAGLSRTAEGAALVASGWAHEVAAARDVVRRVAPHVRTGAEDPRDADAGARLPTSAWQAVSNGVSRGPVLVQVPLGGYQPGLACGRCRAPARCASCSGPLSTDERGAAPSCRWCAVVAAARTCPSCGDTGLRAVAVGLRRTAEELGRAFPRVAVRSSGGSAPVLAGVDASPAIVVATPGAEPVADGGYAAALLLDGWSLLSRPDLRSGEEALRRWLAAAALVRPAPDGGEVVVLADPAQRAVQALVRWSPGVFAERELADRSALALPPAATFVSLTSDPEGLAAFQSALALPDGVDVLGPVQVGEGTAGSEGRERTERTDRTERILLRCARERSRELISAVRAAAGVRSAHKDVRAVRVQVDPREIG